MTYKEAEQRLKELLKTGFLVDVGFEEHLSLEVEKLLHSIHLKDNSLFRVGEGWMDGVFEGDGFDGDFWAPSSWKYFGVVDGVTYLCDEPNFDPVLLPQELEAIVTAFVKGSENTTESKFEAISGDQSLFDLVGATDEHLYIVRNAKHTGIYAATQAQWDKHNYLNKVLAERKVKEPAFIPYRTEDYPHEDCKGGVMAFRSRSGETAINFEEECGRGEVVLSFENTIKFANELLAIANGVERQE